MDGIVTLGRRARNKAAKRAAIARAAASLFDAHGYVATTTQQVAREADVAEGTLFRYATSKAELLLMVVNDHLRLLVEAAPDLPAGTPAEEAVLGILEPIIGLAHEQPENAGCFLREVLFGEHGAQRAESLEIVAGLKARLADALVPHEALLEGMNREEAAGWLFSTVVTELIYQLVGLGHLEPHADLRTRIRVALRGLGIPVAA